MTPLLKVKKSLPEIIISLVLISATLIVYIQVWDHEFINLDDPLYITENSHILEGVTPESIVWAFTNFRDTYWYPLTWLSFLFDIELFGLYAGGFLLENVLFHILNSLLLFFLLKRMTGALWQSAFVAALFALHPLRVESVAWIPERKDVLSTLFWFLTTWAYIRYTESPCVKKYLLVLLTLTLGLMSKLMLMTLPCTLVLLDFWPLKRKKSLSQLLLEKFPLMIPVGILCAITFYIHTQGPLNSLVAISPGLRISHSLVCYVKYIVELIWPKNLVVLTLYPHSIPAMQAAAAFFLLCVLSLLIFREWNRRPYLGVGWLWYLGTLFPLVGIVPSGTGTFADRFTYVPLIGLFIIIAWGVPDLMKKWRYKKIVLAVLSFLVISLLMVRTRSQVALWRNSITLFTHSLASMPDNFMLHTNLGAALAEEGKYNEAITHYREALRANPRHENAHTNLGVALLKLGKPDKAIVHFTRVLKINPQNSGAYANYGAALYAAGEIDRAIAVYKKGLRIQPNEANTHFNLAIAYEKKGDPDKALLHYKEALRSKPNYADAYYNMGNTLFGMGKIDKAISQYREVLRITPNHANAHYNLGIALFKRGETNRAVTHLSEAVRIRPDDENMRTTLDVVLTANDTIIDR